MKSTISRLISGAVIWGLWLDPAMAGFMTQPRLKSELQSSAIDQNAITPAIIFAALNPITLSAQTKVGQIQDVVSPPIISLVSWEKIVIPIIFFNLKRWIGKPKITLRENHIRRGLAVVMAMFLMELLEIGWHGHATSLNSGSIIAWGVIALDQLTKGLIVEYVKPYTKVSPENYVNVTLGVIHYLHMISPMRIALLAWSILIFSQIESLVPALAFGLVLGACLSHLMEGIFLGGAVDWIRIKPLATNVADLCVVMGFALVTGFFWKSAFLIEPEAWWGRLFSHFIRGDAHVQRVNMNWSNHFPRDLDRLRETYDEMKAGGYLGAVKSFNALLSGPAEDVAEFIAVKVAPWLETHQFLEGIEEEVKAMGRNFSVHMAERHAASIIDRQYDASLKRHPGVFLKNRSHMGWSSVHHPRMRKTMQSWSPVKLSIYTTMLLLGAASVTRDNLARDELFGELFRAHSHANATLKRRTPYFLESAA